MDAPRYRIGNDLSVFWAIHNRDGSPFDMGGMDVRLFVTNERGRKEVDIFLATLPDGTINNVIRWDFKGEDQRVLGLHTLTVEISESATHREIIRDYCQAFELVGRSELETEEGDANISIGGDLILSSKLDIYRFEATNVDLSGIKESIHDLNETIKDINEEAIGIKVTINEIQSEVNDIGTEMTNKASVDSVIELGDQITEVQTNVAEQTIKVNSLGAEIATKASADSVTKIADELAITNESLAEQVIKVTDLAAEVSTKASSETVTEIADDLKITNDTLAEQTLKVDTLSAEISTKASAESVADIAGELGITNKSLAEQTIKVEDLEASIENFVTKETFDTATGQIEKEFTSVKQTSNEIKTTIQDQSGEITQIKQDVNGISVGLANVESAQKITEETLTELTDVLTPEEMSTQIGKGVVLSTVIATTDTNGNITAAMNASHQFSDDEHGRIVMAGGVKGSDWSQSAFKFFEDGHIYVNSGEFGENVQVGGALVSAIVSGAIDLFSYPENGKLVPLFQVNKDASGKITSIASVYDMYVNGNLIVSGDTSSGGEGEDVVVGVTSIIVNGFSYPAENGAIDLSEAFEGISVDLSNYYTKSEVNKLIDDVSAGDIDLANYYTKEQVDTKFAQIDFTPYATKASVNGVSARVSTLESYFATSEDADTQINKWNEIVAFLNATEGTTLSGILGAYTLKSVHDAFVASTNTALGNRYTKTEVDSKYDATKTWADTLASLIVNENGNIRIKTNLIVSGDTASGGGGGDTPTTTFYLKDLLDVDIPSPVKNDLLMFNGSKWINIPQSSIVPDLESQKDNWNGIAYTEDGQTYIGKTLLFSNSAESTGSCSIKVEHSESNELLLPSESGTLVTREWVEENIKNVANATSVTYYELASLILKEALIAGHYYRITDYVTKTAQEYTSSSEKKFDVVVLALSSNKLSEEAFAAPSSEGTQFALNEYRWKIWYCFENNTQRFAWADDIHGKGVIYRMIDENGIDCPYDFKNIQFYRMLSRELQTSENKEWATQRVANGLPTGWVFMNTEGIKYFDDKHTVFSRANTWETRYFFTFWNEDNEHSTSGNVRNVTILPTFDVNGRQQLNNNVFFSGGGTIENIRLGYYNYNNTFRSVSNVTFGDSCAENNLAGVSNIVLGNRCYLNVIHGSNVKLGNFSSYNTLGSNVSGGPYCSYNSFVFPELVSMGDHCEELSCSWGAYETYYLTFGNYCKRIAGKIPTKSTFASYSQGVDFFLNLNDHPVKVESVIIEGDSRTVSSPPVSKDKNILVWDGDVLKYVYFGGATQVKVNDVNYQSVDGVIDLSGAFDGVLTSVSWENVDGRPTALSQFTNDLNLGSLAYKNGLTASDVGALSTAGGKLTGLLEIDSTPALHIYRSDGVNIPYIRFGKDADNIYGAIGFRNDGEIYYYNQTGAQTWTALLHAGNVGDYALKYQGISLPDNIKSGFGYNSEPIGYPHTGGFATFGNGVYGFQIMGYSPDAKLSVRGLNNGTWSDWKTIITSSGGTMLAGAGIYNPKDTTKAAIAFNDTYNGFGSQNFPTYIRSSVTPTMIVGSNNYTLIHSGNVGDYAPLRKSRQSTIDLNTAANGYYEVGYSTQTATNTPSDFSNNASLLIDVRDANGYAKIQLLGQNAPSKLWFRAQQGVGSEITSAWKEIAFTNSDITGSVLNSNGDLLLTYNDGLLLGYGSAAKSKNTIIYGDSVVMRYSSSRTTGLILNSSGNVTIGSSDLASTSYKLYVSGNTCIGYNGIYGEGNESMLRGSANAISIGYGYRNLTTDIYGGTIRFYRGEGTTSMLIDSLGNVGIGVNPQYTLDVAGKGRFTENLIVEGNASISTILYLTRDANVNYIWANKAGSTIALGVQDAGSNGTSYASLLITASTLFPGYRSGVVSLGSASYRWSTIYGVKGDFSNAVTVSGALLAKGGFEVYGSTPYIDFHYGNSTADYTSRIIEDAEGRLYLNRVLYLVNGERAGVGGINSSYKFNVEGTTRLNGATEINGDVVINGNLIVEGDTASGGTGGEASVGSIVAFSPLYTGGMAIGTITIDGISTGIFVPSATATQYGLVKPCAVRTGEITAITGVTTSGKYYGVEMDSTGKMFVNVPWKTDVSWSGNYGVLMNNGAYAQQQLVIGGIPSHQSSYPNTTYALYLYGSARSTGTFTSASDMTLKNVVNDVFLTVDTIANAPAFEFRWKNSSDSSIWLGTSAQYWKAVLPNAVKGNEGDYSLAYGELAMVSVITVAKTVRNNEERIRQLELKVVELEQQLAA